MGFSALSIVSSDSDNKSVVVRLTSDCLANILASQREQVSLVDSDRVAAAISAIKHTSDSEVVTAVTNLGSVDEKIGRSRGVSLVVGLSECIELNVVELDFAGLDPSARSATIGESDIR